MFKVGDEVSYGMHGRCVIESIETKTIGGNSVDFYAIRTVKFNLNNKTVNKNSAILVPVANANAAGLRNLISPELADKLMLMASDRDYYFAVNETWFKKQKNLEDCLRKEGAEGLLKVVAHLFVMTKKDPAPNTEANKLLDSLSRILVREISEAKGLALKDVEAALYKAFRNKLLADN